MLSSGRAWSQCTFLGERNRCMYSTLFNTADSVIIGQYKFIQRGKNCRRSHVTCRELPSIHGASLANQILHFPKSPPSSRSIAFSLRCIVCITSLDSPHCLEVQNSKLSCLRHVRRIPSTPNHTRWLPRGQEPARSGSLSSPPARPIPREAPGSPPLYLRSIRLCYRLSTGQLKMKRNRR